MNKVEERTIALAGVLQACQQVQSLARKGVADDFASSASLKSILVLDALNPQAIFGGFEGVRNGLSIVADGVMTSAHGDSVEVLRYAMAILHLQSQLYKDGDRFREFSQRVEGLSALNQEDLVSACADVYRDYVSHLKPQLIVQGEQDHLQDPKIPPQVRAMLLAGIRSAVLWQQKGGGRFRLLWERTRMQNSAQSLLQESKPH
jgi:high frequency lysogenization protein